MSLTDIPPVELLLLVHLGLPASVPILLHRLIELFEVIGCLIGFGFVLLGCLFEAPLDEFRVHLAALYCFEDGVLPFAARRL
jgi:hypothetical protein